MAFLEYLFGFEVDRCFELSVGRTCDLQCCVLVWCGAGEFRRMWFVDVVHFLCIAAAFLRGIKLYVGDMRCTNGTGMVK